MTITITLTAQESGVGVEVEADGVSAATHRERLFALGIVEAVKTAVPAICTILGGEQTTCIERKKPSTTE